MDWLGVIIFGGLSLYNYICGNYLAGNILLFLAGLYFIKNMIAEMIERRFPKFNLLLERFINKFQRLRPFSSLTQKGINLVNRIFLGITKTREYYKNGNIKWEATFKYGKREGLCKAYFEENYYGFQESEFRKSLDQIKPLLAKLGQTIDKFVDIGEAVDWLNNSTEPYQNYIKHIETNKISQNIEKLLPYDFKSMLNYQLIQLASTAKGQEFKREILNYLYPQETPKRSEKGQLRSDMNYKNGKADGVCKTYYMNGKLQSESIFKDGEQTGVNKVFYENE